MNIKFIPCYHKQSSLISHFFNWSSWALNLVGFMMALFLLWSALKGNVFTDLKRDEFDFPIVQKAEHQRTNEYNLIQPSFGNPMWQFIQFWITSIFSFIMTLLKTCIKNFAILITAEQDQWYPSYFVVCISLEPHWRQRSLGAQQPVMYHWNDTHVL